MKGEGWKLPGVEIHNDITVPLADGTRLSSDLYLPALSRPAPALIMRTPYGKRNVLTQGYAHPVWYASHGYAVICQDVRGRWDSDGDFYPFANEGCDGADAIAWVAQQSWCTGAVGMYGFSYPGAVQLLAAAHQPPALQAMAPGMTGSNFCEGWTFNGGVLNLAFILSWAVDLGRDQALRAGDLMAVAAFESLRARPQALFAHVPVREALPPELSRYVPYLSDWLDHPHYDTYWRQWAPRELYGRMQIPGLHIAGWYDSFLEGTLENYAGLVATGRASQLLIVGPWSHMPWSRHVGEVDFGEQAANTIDSLQLRFFDRWLKGDANGLDDEPPVRVFEMGTNEWRYFDCWPPKGVTPVTLFLHSDGRAGSINGSGQLLPQTPETDSAHDVYPANPHLPILSIGGRGCCSTDAVPMGPGSRQMQEARNEVLVYDTPPLERDLICVGVPSAELHVASSAQSSDFIVHLVDVYPDGRAIGICDGLARVAHDGSPQLIVIRLSPTAMRFRAGHTIRLEIASNDFPLRARNPQTPGDPLAASLLEFKVATQVVFHDAWRPSRLELPVLAG